MKKKIIPVVIGVIKKGDKYLLTKRQSPKDEWNKWQFPGGELEFGESLENCLKREIKEETTLELKKITFVNKIFEVIKNDYHFILITYLCSVGKNQPVFINNEASAFGWFSYQEIMKLDCLERTKEIISYILKNKF